MLAHQSGQARLPEIVDVVVSIEVIVVDGKQLLVDAIAMLKGGLTFRSRLAQPGQLAVCQLFQNLARNGPIQSERHEVRRTGTVPVRQVTTGRDFTRHGSAPRHR